MVWKKIRFAQKLSVTGRLPMRLNNPNFRIHVVFKDWDGRRRQCDDFTPFFERHLDVQRSLLATNETTKNVSLFMFYCPWHIVAFFLVISGQRVEIIDCDLLVIVPGTSVLATPLSVSLQMAPSLARKQTSPRRIIGAQLSRISIPFR